MRAVALRLELWIEGVRLRREIFERAEVEQMQRPQHLKATYHDMRADRRTDFSDAGRLVYRAIEARDAGGVESAALPAPRRQRTKLEDGLSEHTAERVLIGCDTGALEIDSGVRRGGKEWVSTVRSRWLTF